MAYNGFHRSVQAGVALAGAGAIAFAAVPAPAAEEIVAAPPAFVAAPRVVTTEIDPVALETALQLATAAVATLQQSLGAFGDDFPAAWNLVSDNWADTSYLTVNYSLVASSFLTPVAPLVVGPFSDAVADAVGQVLPGQAGNLKAAVDYVFARLVGPYVSAISAIGVWHKESFDLGAAGQTQAQIASFFTTLPRVMADGFLFGGYGDLSPLLTGEFGGERVAAPGLLTPLGQWPADRNLEPGQAEDRSSAIVDVSETSASDLSSADAAAATVATSDHGADAAVVEADEEPQTVEVADTPTETLPSESAETTAEKSADEVESAAEPTETTADAETPENPEKSEGPEKSEEPEQADTSEKNDDSEKSASGSSDTE